MSLVYNVSLEIAGALYLMVILSVLLAYYPKDLEVNKKFKVVVICLLLAEIMDIVTAVSISYSSVIPTILNIVLNTIYFAFAVSSAYAFFVYIESYIRQEKRGKIVRINRIFYYLMLIVLLLNMFGGFLFSFNAEGEYVHGKLYLCVYGMPLYYILSSAVVLIRKHMLFKMKQKISMGIYVLMCLLGPVMQMLFFPDVLLGMFTPSIAVLIILFSMETPDYALLKKTIGELDNLQKHLHEEVKKQTYEIEQRGEKLARLSKQVVLTLAKTIDAKDKYTHGHSERVADYSREIARRMGMSAKEQQNIYYMGLLHDIGKIGIPDTIINKTGKLTEEEYQIIKMHPVYGEEILKNITEIHNVSVGAKYHHERYDGKGYAEGLRGEDIPLAARIIGIADAYDAMTSKRSYREVLPQEVVRNEILKGKGTQFEPRCADVMLEMMDEDKDYQMREH